MTLTFHREDTALIARSAFLSHLGSRQSRVFSVETLADCHVVQRRANLRLDAECPVEYTVVGGGVTGRAHRLGNDAKHQRRRTAVHGSGADRRDRGRRRRPRARAGGRSGRGAHRGRRRARDRRNRHGAGRTPHAPGLAPRPPRTLVAVRFVSISDGAGDLIVRRIFALQRLRREGPAGHLAGRGGPTPRRSGGRRLPLGPSQLRAGGPTTPRRNRARRDPNPCRPRRRTPSARRGSAATPGATG